MIYIYINMLYSNMLYFKYLTENKNKITPFKMLRVFFLKHRMEDVRKSSMVKILNFPSLVIPEEIVISHESCMSFVCLHEANKYVGMKKKRLDDFDATTQKS
ncbi:Uncharacterised protein at_DN2016 [Pycnogonum litorale]